MMRPLHRVLVLSAALLVPQLACAQDGDPGMRPAAALRAGRYAEAIELGRAALQRSPGDVAARRVLTAALRETGRYAEAAAEAGDLENARGEALRAQGRLAEAEAAFRKAAAQPGADQLTAELNLAVLLHDRGEREEALRRFDRFIDVYNDARSLGSGDLTAVASAVRHLGVRDPQLFKDALKAYDEAIAADPANQEARVRLGELFLEKYRSPEAQATFREVLSANPFHPRALLGMARAKEFDGELREAHALLRRSLEVNPRLVPARVMLARMALDGEDPGAAEAEIREALEVDAGSLDALSVLGAIRFVHGDRRGYEELRQRVLGINPVYAGFDATVAEIAARYRRYADAARLAQEAVRLDPRSWTGYGVLGLNQLRLGRVDEARASLERSFQGDPYNAWIKNTLDLLDTFSQYELRRTPRFEFMLHGDEAELLFPYLSELAEESYDRLAERYGYRPEVPVRVEVYPRHADFSVRTVGLAGLGALGVSFGNVLAMDSPAARGAGQFNWGTTLWHELAHAVTLGLSGNRVPRWLTEGISVLEERRARPGWGSETTPEFMTAYLDGELPPVSRLNEGFIRPRTPQHVGLAYHMASLVAQWIEETRGFAALPRMLRQYGEGRGTADVLRSVLGAEPEAIDREFDAWLRAQHPAERIETFQTHHAQGRRLLQAGDLAGARRELEAAAKLYPVGGGAPPHALLAQIHHRQNDSRAAADALSRHTAVDENAYAENLRLADLLLALGDSAGAQAALERAVYIHPYDLALHARLAELYTRSGEHARAVRERRAVVALRPADRAEALYQLALAMLRANDRDGARREVLRALEVAPGFERAQELLLRLRDPAGGTP